MLRQRLGNHAGRVYDIMTLGSCDVLAAILLQRRNGKRAMRGFGDWVLKPLLTAVFVIVLAGLIQAFLPKQYSFTAIRDHLVKKGRPDYDRNLFVDCGSCGGRGSG